MNFSVACSWERPLVDALVSLQETTGASFELFGGLRQSIVGSGHSAISVKGKCNTRDEVAAFTNYARERGIKFNYTVNASCIGNQESTRQGRREIIEYLQWVAQIADAVTLTIPLLIEIVKERFDLEIVVSTIAAVDCARRVQFFQSLGADRIVLDIRANRDFELLRGIKDIATCDIELMVNNGCLLDCPYQYYHYNTGSHASHEDEVFYIDYCVQKCFDHRMSDLAEYVKIPWIRPEDLHHYQSVADWFKIAGREMSTEWIANCAKAYANQEYEGNLLDLITMVLPSVNEFAQIMLPPPPRLYLDNRKLDGFLEHWIAGRRCVNCEACQYCRKIASEHIQADMDQLTTYRQRLSDFLPFTLNIDKAENTLKFRAVHFMYHKFVDRGLQGKVTRAFVQTASRLMKSKQGVIKE